MTTWWLAKLVDADLIGGTVEIDLAGKSIDALSCFTTLCLWIGAGHLCAGIVYTDVAVTESSMATRRSRTRIGFTSGCGSCGVAVFVGSASGATLVTGVSQASTIDTFLSCWALDTCTSFDALSIAGTAGFIGCALFIGARICTALSLEADVACWGALWRLIGASRGDASARLADLLLGAVRINSAGVVRFDAKYLCCTSRGGCVVTDFDLKVRIFSSICGARRPFDFACCGINGRSCGAFVELPRVRVSRVGVGDRGLVAHLLVCGRFCWRCRGDDWGIVDVGDFGLPRLFGAGRWCRVVTNLDLKVDFFSSVSISRGPFDLACCGIDGSAGRSLVCASCVFGEVPCQHSARVRIGRCGFVVVGLVLGRCGGRGRSNDRGIVDVGDLDLPCGFLAGRGGLAVADFDLKLDFFASVSVSRGPRDLASDGVDRCTYGGLGQLVGKSVAAVYIGGFDLCGCIRLIFCGCCARQLRDLRGIVVGVDGAAIDAQYDVSWANALATVVHHSEDNCVDLAWFDGGCEIARSHIGAKVHVSIGEGDPVGIA